MEPFVYEKNSPASNEDGEPMDTNEADKTGSKGSKTVEVTDSSAVAETSDVVETPAVAETPALAETPANTEKPAEASNNETTSTPVDSDKEDLRIWSHISTFFGMSKDIPEASYTNFMTRSKEGKTRNLYFTNTFVRDLIDRNQDRMKVRQNKMVYTVRICFQESLLLGVGMEFNMN